jgi:hypothetical protein
MSGTHCGIVYHAAWEVTEGDEYYVQVNYENAQLGGSVSLVDDDDLEGKTIQDWVLDTVAEQQEASDRIRAEAQEDKE